MPGRTVCFVCGSQGAENYLRIRQHDRDPYFPFLVHHDPPKGARLPTTEGVIDSCRLCFMFLTQQWDSYERSKTPLVKRLYWLKRMDNGTFTGAEMRVQGEYIAQVMGLQYPPGYDDGSSPVNPDREFANQPKQSNTPSFSYGGNERTTTESGTKASTKDNSILDLSTPKKDTERKAMSQEKQRSKSSTKEGNSICYICGQNDSLSVRNYLSVVQQGYNEPFFPILEKLTPAQGSENMTKSGCVKTCTPCRNILFQQWQAYEMTGTPLQTRNYKLPSPNDFIREQGATQHIKREDPTPEKPNHMCCYICGGTYIVEHVRLLNTLPPGRPSSTTMFYPFVRDLKRPSNAEPLRSDGSVIVCIKCYGHLSYQWEIQEVKSIPLYQRQYSLHFLKEAEESTESYQKQQESSHSSPKPSEQIKPLNIHISATSPVHSTPNSEPEFANSQGLLAIAATADVESRGSSVSCSPVKNVDSMLDSRADCKTVPHPLQKVCNIPKKICFLCGERCIIHKMKSLFSYPARHEAKHSNQVEPFFPFLETVTPPAGADPISDEGSVITCKLCFYSLLKQWSQYEQSGNPSDSNRWLRKYVMSNYICYVCSIEGDRKFFRTIAADKFYFLKNFTPPKDALIIDDGQRVVVCKDCAYSLMQQFAEFERMGLPAKLRKFNWVQRSGKMLNDGDENQEYERPGTSSEQEQFETQGGPHGSKPLALNMMNSAGSKLQRNTATVSPLHHVTSPTNGVNSIGANAALNASRTSSFAAALRKLANQAKDPPDDSSGKSSTSTSPRDSAPKAGPPPLVYTSTTLTSPPVVTIAPTQSHPSLLPSDARPSLERLHSSSSVFEAVNSKSDRPHSSASRDDDRALSRDAQSQSVRRMTPHSTTGTVSPMSGREESLARGFQPYRPGDDMRPPPLSSSLALDQAAAAAAAAAYPYPAAFLPPQAFPHPAFRFDDPLLLERYRMMQSPYLPYPQGMMPHPGLHQLLSGGSRYPSDLFPPQFAAFSQLNRMPEHRSPSVLSERQRLEDEKQRELEREREKERDREKERELAIQRQRALEREAEKQRERERHVQRELERRESTEKLRHDLAGSDRREDSLPAKFGSVIQGTSKGLGIADRYPRVPSSNMLNHEKRKDERKEEYMINNRAPAHSHTHKGYSDDPDKRYSYVNPMRDGDRLRPPPLISPQTREDPHGRHSKSGDSGLFRPFDNKSVPNGYGSTLGEKRDRESVFNFMDSKKYSHDKPLSLSHDRKPSERDTREPDPYKFGSTSSAFHSLDNHVSKMETSPSPSLRNSQYHQSSSSKDPPPGVQHTSYHTPLNVPSYSSSNFVSTSSASRVVRESQACVSKLDLKEKRRSESQLGEQCCSDSDCDQTSEEEQGKGRKLLIASGPPLKLDKSPKKIELLNQLGLTTQQQKNDVDFEKIRKHRRLMKERSVSPVAMEESALRTTPLKTSYHADELCNEPDYKSKCQFLSHMLQLQPVCAETRKVNGVILKAIEADKKKRNKMTLDLQAGSTRGESTISEQRVGVKRKLMDELGLFSPTEGNKNIFSPPDISRNDGRVFSQEIDKQGVKLESDLQNEGRPQQGDTKLGSDFNHPLRDRNTSTSETVFSGPPPLYGKNFVQEFHDSVLQTTRMKDLQKNTNYNLEESQRRQRLSESTSSQESLPWQPPRNEHWQGIDVIMEAYQRHQQGERLERAVLSERNKKLRTEHADLNRVAEQMNQQVEDLMKSKQQLEELRQYNQKQIDSLKSNMRKLK